MSVQEMITTPPTAGVRGDLHAAGSSVLPADTMTDWEVPA